MTASSVPPTDPASAPGAGDPCRRAPRLRPSDWLELEAAAEAAGVPEQAIIAAVTARQLRVVCDRDGWRIHRAWISLWAASRAQGAPTPERERAG